jgi:hypothetical protein
MERTAEPVALAARHDLKLWNVWKELSRAEKVTAIAAIAPEMVDRGENAELFMWGLFEACQAAKTPDKPAVFAAVTLNSNVHMYVRNWCLVKQQSPTELTRIADHLSNETAPSEFLIESLVSNPNFPSTDAVRFVGSAKWSAKCLIGRKDANPAALKTAVLAAVNQDDANFDYTTSVYETITRHPQADADLLRAAWKHLQNGTMLSHPHTPADVIVDAFLTGTPVAQEAAVKSKSLAITTQMLNTVSLRRAKVVTAAVGHPNVTPELLEKFSFSANKTVITAVLKHPLLPLERKVVLTLSKR